MCMPHVPLTAELCKTCLCLLCVVSEGDNAVMIMFGPHQQSYTVLSISMKKSIEGSMMTGLG